MKRSILAGLVALCVAFCATDEPSPQKNPAPSSPQAVTNPSEAPSVTPKDAEPPLKLTSDSAPKSASVAPPEPVSPPAIQPKPTPKKATPEAKAPTTPPNPSVTNRPVLPSKPGTSGTETPSLTLVHAANLQGEIEPCG